jgi:ornithine cyclodeaminase
LHAGILLRPDARVVVEFEPQSRIEGEIQQLAADFPVTELTLVVTGRKPGRANDAEVTVFDSVGFALQDFSALRYLHRLHQQRRGIRAAIDLIPDLEDPKDLFSLVAAQSSALPRARPVAGVPA